MLGLEDGGSDQANADKEEDELETVEALMTKDKAKKAAAKAQAKAKTEPSDVSAAAVAPKIKGRPKKGAVAKAPAAAAAKPMIKRPAAEDKSKKYDGIPHWGFEDSRSQIMCRTGLEGAGQSHAIKYEVAGGRANAIKLADQWVAKKKKEVGIKKGK